MVLDDPNEVHLFATTNQLFLPNDLAVMDYVDHPITLQYSPTYLILSAALLQLGAR